MPLWKQKGRGGGAGRGGAGWGEGRGGENTVVSTEALSACVSPLPDRLCCPPRKGRGVEVCRTDRVRVPSRLSRKSIRHWEVRSGCSVPLLPRASSWVIPGVGAGLGLTPELPPGRLGACVTSSPAGCGDYAGLPWPGKCGLRTGPVISGASRKRGCPITTSRMCR